MFKNILAKRPKFIKPGEHIKFVIYSGGVKEEADAVYNAMKRCKDKGIPVPVKDADGSDISMNIEDVLIDEDEGVYTIVLKGEIVNEKVNDNN